MKNISNLYKRTLLIVIILLFIKLNVIGQIIYPPKLTSGHVIVVKKSFEKAKITDTSNLLSDKLLELIDSTIYSNSNSIKYLKCRNIYQNSGIPLQPRYRSIKFENEELNKLFSKDTASKYFTVKLPSVSNFNPIIDSPISEIYYSQNSLRRKFIQLRRQYNNAQHIYLFANISPSATYRRLTVSTAQVDNYNTISERNSEKAKFDSLASFSVGAGYSFYNGHSFYAAFYHESMGYSSKNTMVGKTNTIYSGFWIGYRFQRLHQFSSVQPVFDLAYGHNLNHSSNQIKVGLGLSFMCTKNIYINAIPHYVQNFKSEEHYTSSPIATHLYNIGCDIGITYKIFTPFN